jgi:hypothetical protein
MKKPDHLRYADERETVAVTGSRLFLEDEAKMAAYLKQEKFFVVPLDPAANKRLAHYGIEYYEHTQKFDDAVFNFNSTESSEHLFDHIEAIHAKKREGKKILFMCAEGMVGSPTAAAMYLYAKQGIRPSITAQRVSDKTRAEQIVGGALQAGNRYNQQAAWRTGLRGRVRKHWRKTWFHRWRKL